MEIKVIGKTSSRNIHTNNRNLQNTIKVLKERHAIVHFTCLKLIMIQTPASGFPGVEDDLIFSGAGSGCNGDDEDECPPLTDNGSGDDDLITPVYVAPTRPPPTAKPKPPPGGGAGDKNCDDEDCVDGSGSGEVTVDPVNSSSNPNIGWFDIYNTKQRNN